jgi:hypothetical protein
VNVMEAEVPHSAGDFWTEGLDKTFFSNVYSKATWIGLAGALLALGMDQKTVALGVLAGVGTGMFTLWGAEATVRLLFNGGKGAGWRLALAAFVKMPFTLALLFPLAWAAYHKHIDAFALIGGVLLVHATMLIMAISTAMANAHRNRERYR